MWGGRRWSNGFSDGRGAKARNRHTTAVLPDKGAERRRLGAEEWGGSWRAAPLWEQSSQQNEMAYAAMRARRVCEHWWLGVGLFWGRDDLASGERPEEEAQLCGAVELRAACGTEETVVTDFRDAFGQNVLKKPVKEFGSGKRDVADLLSLVVTVAEADNAVVERFQTAVGNGDAEHVAGKIVEDFLATAGVLGMNDPASLPDEGWNESKKPCLFQSGTELGAKDD